MGDTAVPKESPLESILNKWVKICCGPMTEEEMIFFWNSVWSWDFLGDQVVGNLPASAGDTGLIPVQEDPTCFGAMLVSLHHNY